MAAGNRLWYCMGATTIAGMVIWSGASAVRDSIILITTFSIIIAQIPAVRKLQRQL